MSSDVSALDLPWREALDALVRATSQEGLPWSCPGGTVMVVPEPSGAATLTVTDVKGRSASRRLAGPQELVATGEALLASPLTEEPAPGPPPPPPPPRADAPAPAPAAPRDPRIQIAAVVGPRLSGPGLTAWISTEVRAVFPIGPWSLAFWGRYDAPVAGPPDPPKGFEMDAVSVGAGAGRRLLSGPFELRVTLDPSLAIVMMEAGMETMPHPEGAKLAFRIGSGLTGTFRIASVFRGIVSLNGEFAPAGITGLHKIASELPTVPVYTAGLLLGVEASIR